MLSTGQRRRKQKKETDVASTRRDNTTSASEDTFSPAFEMPEGAEDTLDRYLEEGECTEASEGGSKRRRKRLVLVLSALSLLVCAAFIVATVTTTVPSTTTIVDDPVPLANAPIGAVTATSTTTNNSSKSAGPLNWPINSSNGGNTNTSKPDDDGQETGTDDDQGSTTNPPSDGSGGGGGSNPGGGGGSNLTWHAPWNEQVWVDTSGWQSVYVGENPVFEYHSVCNTCGAIISGFAAKHLEETMHGSYSNNVPIQVGSTPLYENRWVESGYWTTITHPGYWG